MLELQERHTLDFDFAYHLFGSWLAAAMWSPEFMDFLSQVSDQEDAEHF